MKGKALLIGSTWECGEQMYYDIRGRPCSRIDHLLCTRRFIGQVKVNAMTKKGFQIQAAKHVMDRNHHLLVELVIQGKTLLIRPEDQYRGWNKIFYWIAGSKAEVEKYFSEMSAMRWRTLQISMRRLSI